jgi:hypothetical protein
LNVLHGSTLLVIALLLPSGGVLAAPIALSAGTQVQLVTAEPLSSKTHVKGDMVALRTTQDVIVGGVIVIPSGTETVGQVVDARAKGGLGTTGKLVVRPLYLRLGDQVVRLVGSTKVKAKVGPDTIVGVWLSAPVSGRSATIPAGTAISAEVEKRVLLMVAGAGTATSP